VVFARPSDFGRSEIWAHRVAEGGLHIRFEDGCEVAVDAPVTRVWCSLPAGLGVADAAIYLVGPIMALALRRRGRTVLHSAALAYGDSAFALMGAGGSGKSTTAAALTERGVPLLTDDVLALREADGVVEAFAGPPRVRLWEDAGAALYGAAHDLPLLTPNWTKRYVDVPERWHPTALPLRTIYLLGPREAGGSTPRVEPVSGREALLALVGSAYHAWLSDADDRARDLVLLGKLVRQARIRRLVPRDDPAALDDLLALIERDLSA
jgi:hypothetical protein